MAEAGKPPNAQLTRSMSDIQAEAEARSVPQLLKFLKDSDDAGGELACTALCAVIDRQATAPSLDPYRLTLATATKANAVSLILKRMDKFTLPEGREPAARMLSHLLKYNDENKVTAVATGLAPLAGLLKLKECAGRFRQAVLEAFIPLGALPQSARTLSAMPDVVTGLCDQLKTSSLRRQLQDKIKAHTAGHDEAKEAENKQLARTLSELAAVSLASLAEHDRDVRRAVLKSGAPSYLSTHLREGSSPQVREASLALLFFSQEQYGWKKAIPALRKGRGWGDATTAIPALSSIVATGSARAREQSAALLAALAGEKGERAEEVAAAGAIPPLVTVLREGDPGGRIQAAVAIERLTRNKLLLGRGPLLRTGAIQGLINLLQESHGAETIVLLALANLSADPEVFAPAVAEMAAHRSQLLPHLLRLVRSNTVTALTEAAAMVLGSLVHRSPETAAAVRAAGGVPPVVQLLRIVAANDDGIITAAARFLHFFLDAAPLANATATTPPTPTPTPGASSAPPPPAPDAGKEAVAAAVAAVTDAGAVPLLMTLVTRTGGGDTCRMHAAATLARVLVWQEGGETWQVGASGAGIIVPLVGLIKGKDMEKKKAGLELLSSLLVTEASKAEAMQAGAVAPLVSLLRWQDAAVALTKARATKYINVQGALPATPVVQGKGGNAGTNDGGGGGGAKGPFACFPCCVGEEEAPRAPSTNTTANAANAPAPLNQPAKPSPSQDASSQPVTKGPATEAGASMPPPSPSMAAIAGGEVAVLTPPPPQEGMLRTMTSDTTSDGGAQPSDAATTAGEQPTSPQSPATAAAAASAAATTPSAAAAAPAPVAVSAATTAAALSLATLAARSLRHLACDDVRRQEKIGAAGALPLLASLLQGFSPSQGPASPSGAGAAFAASATSSSSFGGAGDGGGEPKEEAEVAVARAACARESLAAVGVLLGALASHSGPNLALLADARKLPTIAQGLVAALHAASQQASSSPPQPAAAAGSAGAAASTKAGATGAKTGTAASSGTGPAATLVPSASSLSSPSMTSSSAGASSFDQLSVGAQAAAVMSYLLAYGTKRESFAPKLVEAGAVATLVDILKDEMESIATPPQPVVGAAAQAATLGADPEITTEEDEKAAAVAAAAAEAARKAAAEAEVERKRKEQEEEEERRRERDLRFEMSDSDESSDLDGSDTSSDSDDSSGRWPRLNLGFGRSKQFDKQFEKQFDRSAPTSPAPVVAARSVSSAALRGDKTCRRYAAHALCHLAVYDAATRAAVAAPGGPLRAVVREIFYVPLSLAGGPGRSPLGPSHRRSSSVAAALSQGVLALSVEAAGISDRNNAADSIAAGTSGNALTTDAYYPSSSMDGGSAVNGGYAIAGTEPGPYLPPYRELELSAVLESLGSILSSFSGEDEVLTRSDVVPRLVALLSLPCHGPLPKACAARCLAQMAAASLFNAHSITAEGAEKPLAGLLCAGLNQPGSGPQQVYPGSLDVSILGGAIWQLSVLRASAGQVLRALLVTDASKAAMMRVGGLGPLFHLVACALRRSNQPAPGEGLAATTLATATKRSDVGLSAASGATGAVGGIINADAGAREVEHAVWCAWLLAEDGYVAGARDQLMRVGPLGLLLDVLQSKPLAAAAAAAAGIKGPAADASPHRGYLEALCLLLAEMVRDPAAGDPGQGGVGEDGVARIRATVDEGEDMTGVRLGMNTGGDVSGQGAAGGVGHGSNAVVATREDEPVTREECLAEMQTRRGTLPCLVQVATAAETPPAAKQGALRVLLALVRRYNSLADEVVHMPGWVNGAPSSFPQHAPAAGFLTVATTSVFDDLPMLALEMLGALAASGAAGRDAVVAVGTQQQLSLLQQRGPGPMASRPGFSLALDKTLTILAEVSPQVLPTSPTHI
eukprot:jgi/Mesvir1/12444/Mv00604-RA.1